MVESDAQVVFQMMNDKSSFSSYLGLLVNDHWQIKATIPMYVKRSANQVAYYSITKMPASTSNSIVKELYLPSFIYHVIVIDL